MSKKDKRIVEELRLPLAVIEMYKEIAKLAGTDIQTVVNVVLARDVLVAIKRKEKP